MTQAYRNGELVTLTTEEIAALAPTTAELIAYVAARRYGKEIAGVTYTHPTAGDITIASDDRSKTMITGSALAAQLDSDWTTSWKCDDGSFVALTAAQMLAIAAAVAAHVNGCFATEETVKAAIAAGTTTTFEQIDAAFDA